MNVERTWSISLANRNVRVWFRDDGGSPLLRERIPVYTPVLHFSIFTNSYKHLYRSAYYLPSIVHDRTVVICSIEIVRLILSKIVPLIYIIEGIKENTSL